MPNIGEKQRAKELGYKVTGNRVGDWYIWLPCPICGKERWVQMKRDEPVTKRCAQCNFAKDLFGEANPNWKGGRLVKGDGYIMVLLQPDDFFYPMADRHGYVLEHRLVMAKYLGRCLQRWELVHHKGIRYVGIENRQDNLKDNLELTTNGSHIIEHQRGYRAGYHKGYSDGQSKAIKELEQRITILEAELVLLHSQLEQGQGDHLSVTQGVCDGKEHL